MIKVLDIVFKGTRTRLLLVCFILLSIATGFILLFANDILGQVFNDHVLVQNFDGLAHMLILTIGLFVCVFALNILIAYLRANFQYNSLSRLSGHYIARLLHAKSSYFINNPSAELFARLNEATFSVSFLLVSLLSMVSYGIIFIFYAIIIFRIDTFAGIFSILVTPIYFFANGWAGGKLSDLMHEKLAADGEMSLVTQESFENVNNIKTKNAYTFFIKRSLQVLNKIKKISVHESTLEGYIQGITTLLRIITPLLVIFAVMQFSSHFDGSAAQLILLYINIPLFLVNFANLFVQYIEYKAAKPFIAQLQEYGNVEIENEAGEEIKSFECLRTDNVSVVFDDGRTINLPNFEVKKSEKVMITGESGVGKSTVFNILMGIIPDYKGDIYINNINHRDISLSSLRKIFGITFQHTNAITLDLHQNITLGATITSDNFEKYIRLTAQEYQQDIKGTAVLSNKTLSGGEKSRLGLSQSLVTNPELMLLDEVFSNIDEALESKILADLFNEYPNRTFICISHRNSTKSFFDKIVDFNS